MKIFFTITFILFTASFAKADRWIIKNPKSTKAGVGENIRSQSMIKFENEYLIIETDDQSVDASFLARAFNADSAFRDLKIVIDQPEEKAPEKLAWHVDHLKYDSLNEEHAGDGVIVAVLDTGVDYKHPALANYMWKNLNEIPDNGIDDDNNGLIDDYHGYDFNSMKPDPRDANGHGTHCAGIIASDMDADSGAKGIAPGAKVMALAIIGKDSWGFMSAAALAVKYATDHGAKILSNSWRLYHSWDQYMNPEGMEMLRESISYAGEHEVVFVAAAGNEAKNIDETNLSDPIFPLAFEGLTNMIGVAASQRPSSLDFMPEGKIASFSNYGAESIAVSAPGRNIISTYPQGRWRSLSGTSMATPIVAGALARGMSKGYKMTEALSELNKTTKNTTYWQQYVKHGLIDVENYLK